MHLNSKFLGSLSGLSLLIFAVPLLNNISFTLGSFLLLLISIVTYVLISKKNTNYASLGALFALVFLTTIALSNLKLMDYQREWSFLTWIVMVVGFFSFEMIYELSNYFKTKRIENYFLKDQDNYVTTNQMFLICTIMFLISVFGYTMTTVQCGFIPFFVTDNINAYSEFYTKFLLLSHLCIINIPLSGYLFSKEKRVPMKILLILYMFIQTFVLPILAVNRGIFLIGAITLSCIIFYIYNKRFSVLILCLVLSFVGYEIGSIGRHYSNELLSTSFNQASVETNDVHENNNTETSEILENNNNPSSNNLIYEENSVNDDGSSNETNDNLTSQEINTNQDDMNTIIANNPSTSDETIELINDNTYVVNYNGGKLSDLDIKIPQRILFLYSYLTVSHDNFDLAVKYSNHDTFGLRCLSGFDFLLKRIWADYDGNFDFYQVQSNLNTVNILGMPYYDLKIIGVIIYMCVLAFVCRLVESCYLKTKNLFLLLLLAQMFYCIVLSFFSNYTSQFIFICSLASIVFLYLLFKFLHFIQGVNTR